MKIRHRYRVDAWVPITRNALNERKGAPVTRKGKAVRAVPVIGPHLADLSGFYANSPDGSLGFSVFGANAEKFQVGTEFELVVHFDGEE